MGAVILLGTPLLFGPIIGSLLASVCTWMELNPSMVYAICAISLLPIAAIYFYPRKDIWQEYKVGENWGIWMICSTVIASLLYMLFAYTLGLTFKSYENFEEFWTVTLGLISRLIFDDE